MFNEKSFEKVWDKEKKANVDMEVWQSPKYIESRKKAIELIESGKYGLEEGDFWILMNKTKSGKMAYTGLIISHNGCLKINDNLSDKEKFNPIYLKQSIDNYNNSLIYEYNNPEQLLYEVGEVSGVNCDNSYPYAMAFKRCFDRAVLKISKIAYAGIYSDSEAEEFAERIDAQVEEELDNSLLKKAKELDIDLEGVKKYYKTSKLTNQHLKDAITLKENQTKVNTKSFSEKEGK